MSKRAGHTYWAVDAEILEPGGIEIGATHLKIHEGDQVLWFVRRPLTFCGHGIVQEVKRRPIDSVADRILLSITLVEGDEVIFDDPRLLADFAFSLGCVYRPENPGIHFRRRYRYLNKRDFQVVIDGNVDMAATLFGLFWLEMPSSTKSAFVAFLGERSHPLDETISLPELWKLFDEYVQTEFVAAVHLLQSTKVLSERSGIPDFDFAQLQLDHGDDTISALAPKANELDAFARAYGTIRDEGECPVLC